jgi:ABC-type multidrug transport system fused ATPase/permease subunit
MKKKTKDTIRREINDSTVLCIAHRLRTIAYYDLVIVMDKGSVAEFDEPLVLMNKENSIFREMCLASGDFDELFAAAQRK